MEYKVIEGINSLVQKKLNQWKHQYEIKILAMNTVVIDDTVWITILLTREAK